MRLRTHFFLSLSSIVIKGKQGYQGFIRPVDPGRIQRVSAIMREWAHSLSLEMTFLTEWCKKAVIQLGQNTLPPFLPALHSDLGEKSAQLSPKCASNLSWCPRFRVCVPFTFCSLLAFSEFLRLDREFIDLLLNAIRSSERQRRTSECVYVICTHIFICSINTL